MTKPKKKTPANFLPYRERVLLLTNLQLGVTLPPAAHARLAKLMTAYGNTKKSRVVAMAIMAMRGPKGESMEDEAPGE